MVCLYQLKLHKFLLGLVILSTSFGLLSTNATAVSTVEPDGLEVSQLLDETDTVVVCHIENSIYRAELVNAFVFASALETDLAANQTSFFSPETDIVPPFLYLFDETAGYFPGANWNDQDSQNFLTNCRPSKVISMQPLPVSRLTFMASTTTQEFTVAVNAATLVKLTIPPSDLAGRSTSTVYELEIAATDATLTAQQSDAFLSLLEETNVGSSSVESSLTGTNIGEAVGRLHLLSGSILTTGAIDFASAKNLLNTFIRLDISVDGKPIVFESPVVVEVFNPEIKPEKLGTYGFLTTNSGEWIQQKWNQSNSGLSLAISEPGLVSLWNISMSQPAAVVKSVGGLERIKDNAYNYMPLITFVLLLGGIITLYKKVQNLEILTHTAEGAPIEQPPDPLKLIRELGFLLLLVIEVLLIFYAAYAVFLS